jgi:hypothetical protein
MPACGESLSSVPLPLQPRPAVCRTPESSLHRPPQNHTPYPDPRPTAH